jgi:hypothetical protein
MFQFDFTIEMKPRLCVFACNFLSQRRKGAVMDGDPIQL